MKMLNKSDFYPIEKLKKLKLKYFDFDKVINIDNTIKKNFDKYINVFIFNLKKNVGKTYWMREQINKICDEAIREGEADEHIIMMVRKESQMKIRAKECKYDKDFKYYIKGNSILTKGIIKMDDDGEQIVVGKDIFIGYVIPFLNANNFASLQFNKIKRVFYDEYRQKRGEKNTNIDEFKLFTELVDTFQRGKDDIKFFLFGNNEEGADYIAERIGVSKKTKYFLDYEGGVFYLNDTIFSGLEENKKVASKLSKYDDKTMLFLKENIATEYNKGLIERSDLEGKDKHWFYFVYDGLGYEFKIYDNLVLIESIDNDLDKLDGVVFIIESKDYILCEKASWLPNDVFNYLAYAYKFNLIGMWKKSDLDRWKNIFGLYFDKNIDRENNKDYDI